MNNVSGSTQKVKILIALELKRQRSLLQRTALVLGSGAAIGALLNLMDLRVMAFVLVAAGMSPIVMGGMGVFQDKLEGTMEFLVNLPVSAAILVAGRFGAILVLAIGSSVLCATALAMILPEEPGISRFRVVLGALPALWLVASTIGWASTSLTIRFKLAEIPTRVIIPAMILWFAGAWLFEIGFGHPLDFFRGVIDGAHASWFHASWFLATAFIAVCGLVMAGSWFVACAGVRGFRPDPDALER